MLSVHLRDATVSWVRREAESPLCVPLLIMALFPKKLIVSRPWFAQFINLVSGSHLGVGRGLESCTSIVEHGSAFDLDGRRVVLIDTPGFDDTNLRDVDVLNMIASFLSTS